MLLVGAGSLCRKHMKANTQTIMPIIIIEYLSDDQAKGTNINAEKEKAFIEGKIICALPLAPAAMAAKVGPNEASILVCSEEKSVGWMDRQVEYGIQTIK